MNNLEIDSEESNVEEAAAAVADELASEAEQWELYQDFLRRRHEQLYGEQQ